MKRLVCLLIITVGDRSNLAVNRHRNTDPSGGGNQNDWTLTGVLLNWHGTLDQLHDFRFRHSTRSATEFWTLLVTLLFCVKTHWICFNLYSDFSRRSYTGVRGLFSFCLGPMPMSFYSIRFLPCLDRKSVV